VRRRTLVAGLGGLLAIVGSGALLAGAGLEEWRERIRVGLARRLARGPRLDARAPKGRLTEDEMRSLLALAETVLPPWAAGAPDLVREHVDARTERAAGVLPVYRQSLALLDRATARVRPSASRFRDLAPGDRERVLATVLWAYPAGDRAAALAERWTSSAPVVGLRDVVMRDLIAAFYESPLGWRAVGHTHAWGSPAADPLGYARPPDG
jgi:hypothetical protein